MASMFAAGQIFDENAASAPAMNGKQVASTPLSKPRRALGDITNSTTKNPFGQQSAHKASGTKLSRGLRVSEGVAVPMRPFLMDGDAVEGATSMYNHDDDKFTDDAVNLDNVFNVLVRGPGEEGAQATVVPDQMELENKKDRAMDENAMLDDLDDLLGSPTEPGVFECDF